MDHGSICFCLEIAANIAVVVIRCLVYLSTQSRAQSYVRYLSGQAGGWMVDESRYQ